MGENNSKWSNWQRINLKNTQSTPTAQFQKNKWPNQKIGQRTKQTFLQRRHTNGYQIHETMLNITHYQRVANQNHTWVRMDAIKKSTKSKCWKGCDEKGTFLHRWWECKLVQPLWRTVWRFLKILEIELPYDSGIPLLGICTEETIIEWDTCTPMFITALFTIAHHGSNLDIHWQMNG